MTFEEKIPTLTDEQLRSQIELHEGQLNFGSPERQALHAYCLDQCMMEKQRRDASRSRAT